MGDIGRSQCAIPAKMLVSEQIERKPHGIRVQTDGSWPVLHAANLTGQLKRSRFDGFSRPPSCSSFAKTFAGRTTMLTLCFVRYKQGC